MESNSKILVVGASGTSGRELLTEFSLAGIYIRAMVRNLKQADSLASKTVELVEGDLSNPKSLSRALSGIESVYLVTPIHEDAQKWIEYFLYAAKQSGVQHIIRLSGLGADTESKSKILSQHGYADKRLKESGINYTIIRPNSFYQNLLLQSRQIKRKGKFSLPLGDASQSLIDVRDIAKAVVNIFTTDGHKNKVYNLTGPEPLSFSDVANQLSDVVEHPVKYVPVTLDAFGQGMRAAGMSAWYVRELSEIYDVFASGDYADTTDDLKTLLSQEPRCFVEFAKDHASQF